MAFLLQVKRDFFAKTASNDSSAVYRMVQISQTYSSTDIQDTLVYAEKVISRAKKSTRKSLEACALFNRVMFVLSVCI